MGAEKCTTCNLRLLETSSQGICSPCTSNKLSALIFCTQNSMKEDLITRDMFSYFQIKHRFWASRQDGSYKATIVFKINVPSKIEAVIVDYDDLLVLANKQKSVWYRSSDSPKTTLGSLQEKRRRGRHAKRWENKRRDLTAMDFSTTILAP